MKKMFAILSLVSLSGAAPAATIECTAPWVGGFGNSKASLSFNLGSNGLPTSMTSRFNSNMGSTQVVSDIFTPDRGVDGDYVRIIINAGTNQEIVLGLETPTYKTAQAGYLYLFKGSVTSFPNVNLRSRDEAQQADNQLTSMKCQLQ